LIAVWETSRRQPCPPHAPASLNPASQPQPQPKPTNPAHLTNTNHCRNPQDTAALRDALLAGFPIFKGLGDTTLKKLEAACLEDWEQQRQFHAEDEAALAAAQGDDRLSTPAPQPPKPCNLATALLGDGWGTFLELPATAAAAAALAERAASLPGWDDLRKRVRAGGALAASASPGDDVVARALDAELLALEAYWDEISDLPNIPPAENPLKGKQGKVVKRLRGLVALARAVGATQSPGEVLEVGIEVLTERGGRLLGVERLPCWGSGLLIKAVSETLMHHASLPPTQKRTPKTQPSQTCDTRTYTRTRARAPNPKPQR